MHHCRLLAFVCAAAIAGVSNAEQTIVEALFSNNTNLNQPPPLGTNVQLGLNLYKVTDVDMTRGVLQLKVWVRMAWMDPRLRWDVAQYRGINQVALLGRPQATLHGLASKSIWVPEVELVNGEESLYELPEKDVMVYSDGSCFWSRPGTLQASCTMEGLQDFPFDRLTCRLKFQGWTLDDRTQNLSFYNPPWATEKVPEVSFQQFHLAAVSSRRVVEAYACCPGGWPFLEFGLQIGRSQVHYVLKVCMVNTLFTTLAFGVLFVSPSARFNRLGFSITLMLTLTAADIVQSAYLPISDIVLWIQFYIMLSWCFAFLTTLESFVVIILYNMPAMHTDRRLGQWTRMFEQAVEGESPARRWWRYLASGLTRGRKEDRDSVGTRVATTDDVTLSRSHDGLVDVGDIEVASSASDVYTVPPEHTAALAASNSNGGRTRIAPKGAAPPASPKGGSAFVRAMEQTCSQRRSNGGGGAESAAARGGGHADGGGASVLQTHDAIFDSDLSANKKHRARWADLMGVLSESRTPSKATRTSAPPPSPAPPSSPRRSASSNVVVHDATVLKSILATDIDGVDAAMVRRAFHLLDDRQRGHIEVARMRAFLQHFGNSIDIHAALLERSEADGRWDVGEFTALCVALIEDLGAEWFERVLTSVEATRRAQEQQLERLWHSRAVTVDSWGRILLPLIYYTSIGLLSCSRLPDPTPRPLLAAEWS